MAPIRDGHSSSDIVVFILAFCLFCGNCVCTLAFGINRWQSVLSEASPRHLNHPLRVVAWDKFIRNICTVQQRKWCTLCVFCRLGLKHGEHQMTERFGFQNQTVPSVKFTSSFISAKWVYRQPGAFAWTCEWNEWKTQSYLTLFYISWVFWLPRI